MSGPITVTVTIRVKREFEGRTHDYIVAGTFDFILIAGNPFVENDPRYSKFPGELTNAEQAKLFDLADEKVRENLKK